MSRFIYLAVGTGGQRKTGTIRSHSSQEAVLKLMEIGYHPLSVRPIAAAAAASSKGWRQRFCRVRVTDLAVFTRQMASLLKAGLPMVQALTTLRRQCSNARLGEIVEAIEESLSQDAGPLSESLDEYPQVFDPVYRGLVRSGEEAGNLPEVLNNLAKHLGQSAKLRGQVIGAFIYPAFLLILGLTAIFVLMTFVIPRFQELFESFKQNLPWPTQVLITLSAFLSTWWWAVVVAVAAVVSLACALLRKRSIREKVDRRLIRLPLFGPMLLKVEIARISHTFAALLNSGVPILDALRVTGDTARNLAMKGTFPNLVKGISSGQTLAEAMDKTGLYPPMVVNLIRTGEDTGELPEMLTELSSIYEDEAERTVTGTVKLLEPLLIVLMGGIIAGIVAAVILPIFRINAMVAN
ncbi:MAG: type II secretion system F family protein [Planctomycetota bacterium]|nr:type II secretion system F family protein [Planctomycetota bacterium]